MYTLNRKITGITYIHLSILIQTSKAGFPNTLYPVIMTTKPALDSLYYMLLSRLAIEPCPGGISVFGTLSPSALRPAAALAPDIDFTVRCNNSPLELPGRPGAWSVGLDPVLAAMAWFGCHYLRRMVSSHPAANR